MKKIKLLILCLPFAMIASCMTNNAATNSASILGLWEWQESNFVARGVQESKTHTPENRGYYIQLDIREAEIDIIKDGEVAATVPYKLIDIETDVVAIEVGIPNVDFPFFVASGPISVTENTLLISGGYNDAGENQKYTRNH